MPCVGSDEETAPLEVSGGDLHRDSEVTEMAYLAGVDAMVTGTRKVVLAAMDGDKLLSYHETFAVGDTAYLSQLRVSDEALSGHMGGLLLYEASQFWRRSGLVKQLCTGPTTPARPGISGFETRWGLPIVMMPARNWSPRPFRAVLLAARPVACYRVTGLPAPEPSPQGPLS